MRAHSPSAVLLAGEITIAGLTLASLAGCVPPRVIAAASGVETPDPGSSSAPGSSAAHGVIGQVRLGSGLDMDGKVPPCLGATHFKVGDAIQFSLWKMTDAPEGAVVRVSVLDSTDRIVWSEDKAAARGGSYLSFAFGRTLVRGKYRADVTVGPTLMSRTGFEIVERKAL